MELFLLKERKGLRSKDWQSTELGHWLFTQYATEPTLISLPGFKPASCQTSCLQTGKASTLGGGRRMRILEKKI